MRKIIFFIMGVLAICLSMSADGVTRELAQNLSVSQSVILVILIGATGVGMAILGVTVKKCALLFVEGNDRDKLVSILRILIYYNLIFSVAMILNMLADYVILKTWLKEYLLAAGVYGLFFILASLTYIYIKLPKKL